MRAWLTGAIILVSVVAGSLSEIALFRIITMPDDIVAMFAVVWVAAPFLAATILALRHRDNPFLIVLLVCIIVVGIAGASILHSSANRLEIAEQEAKNVLKPDEDPNRGPGGVRKAGAVFGVFAGGMLSITYIIVLPAAQLLVVFLTVVVMYFVRAFSRNREAQQANE